jgi:hypothetical protein
MAASVLVGLSARLLQWQNPAEFGAQFLNALRARGVLGTFGRIAGPRSVRQVFSGKSGNSAVGDTKSGLSASFRLDQRNNIQSP